MMTKKLLLQISIILLAGSLFIYPNLLLPKQQTPALPAAQRTKQSVTR